MIKDPDRALVGVATIFNQRSRERLVLESSSIQKTFLALERLFRCGLIMVR
jgi:hypothetical protein